MSSDTNSQSGTTPRSVLSDPNEVEIETANMLLSLGSTENIDKAIDNEELMPVNKAPAEDFAKDLATQEHAQRELPAEDLDSDKTVEYCEPHPDESEETPSPKGVMQYKHYGIKRRSPSKTKVRRLRCMTCDAVCDSKRQLNKHHRTEHANVTCVDCNRILPMPDALTRHRYIHKEDHQYSCDICGKTCPFQSDLLRHMEKHKENSQWKCNHADCAKEFKRKAELVTHMVTHTGKIFMCEYPRCEFTNKDPRNVKRHYRVHTREKKVKCKKCEERFVFYMQMKRHMERDH